MISIDCLLSTNPMKSINIAQTWALLTKLLKSTIICQWNNHSKMWGLVVSWMDNLTFSNLPYILCKCCIFIRPCTIHLLQGVVVDRPLPSLMLQGLLLCQLSAPTFFTIYSPTSACRSSHEPPITQSWGIWTSCLLSGILSGKHLIGTFVSSFELLYYGDTLSYYQSHLSQNHHLCPLFD